MSHAIGRFGTLTDRTIFEADGTMKAEGAATTFDDLIGDVVSLQATGPGVSRNAAENTVDYTTASNLSDYTYGNIQLPHKWKAESTVYPHIHYLQTAAGAPNWLIQYRWRSNNAAAGTTWTNLACNTNVFTYVSGTLVQIAKTASGISTTGKGLSDILQLRLLRDNANTSTVFAGADPIAATVSVLFFDTHYEADTLGSRAEYTK